MATQIGSLVIELSANVARLQQDMQAVKRTVDDGMGSVTSAASTARNALGALGVGLSLGGTIAAISGISDALLDAQRQTDKFRNALTAVSGAGSVAGELEFVRKTARDLGIDLLGASDAYVKLAASAQGTSLAGEETRKIFTAVSQAATTLGLSGETTSGALLAISQMMSKGTVQAEELRGQLGERLPGAFNLAAAAMGVTTAELGKMLEQGQVIAEDFLPRFADALIEAYGGQSLEAAKSATRETTRLKNAWLELKQAVADEGGASAVGGAFKTMGDWLTNFTQQMALAKADGQGLFQQIIAGFINSGETIEQGIDRIKEKLKDPNLDAYLTKVYGGMLTEAERQLGVINRGSNEAAYGAGEVATYNAEAAAITKASAALDKLKSQYAALSADLEGQTKKYQDGLRLIQAARIAGIESEETLNAKTMQLIESTKSYKDVAKARSDAEKESQKQTEALNGAYYDAIGINKDYTEKVGLYVTLLASGKITQEEYNDAIKRLAEAQPVVRDHTKQLAEETKKANEESKRAAELSALLESLRQDEARAIAKQYEEAEKGLQTAIEENAKIGLTKEQITELSAKRLDAAAAAIDQRLAERDLTGTFHEQFESLVKLRNTYKKTAEEIRSGATAQALQDQAKQASEDWKKASEDINKSLTDALLRGFESGKGFGENLVATLKNMFSTLVLRPVISAVLSPVSQALGGFTNAAGAANLGGLAGGAGSILGGLGGAWNAFTGIGSSFAMSGLGQALGLSTAVAGADAAIIGSSSLLTGAGSFVSAAAPWALGALALASIFGGSGGGPKSGGSSVLDFLNGTVGSNAARLYTPNDADASVFGLSSSALGQIRALAALFGGSAGDLTLGLGYDTDPQGSAPNRLTSLLSRGGRTLYGQTNLDLGRDDATLKQALADEVSKLVVAGLATSNLPGRIGEYFSSVDLSSLTGAGAAAMLEAATNAQAMADAVRDLGGVFDQVSLISVEARAGILEMVGGLEQFNAKLDTFVDAFFTADERAGIQASQALRELGAVGIDAGSISSRGGVRALMDSLDLSTDAGGAQFAALLNVAGLLSALGGRLDDGDSLSSLAALAPGGGLYEVLTNPTFSGQGGADSTTQDVVDTISASLTQSNSLLESIDGRLASIDGLLASQSATTAMYGTAPETTTLTSDASSFA